MPISPPILLTALADSVDRLEYSTTPVAFVAGDLALVFVTYTGAGVAALDVVCQGGGVGAFTLLQENGISSSSRRELLFGAIVAIPGAAAAIRVATLLVTAFSSMIISVVRVPNITGAVITSVEKNSGTGITTLAVVLAPFGPTNVITFGQFCTIANAAITPGAGFSNLDDQGTGTPLSRQSVQWVEGADLSVDASFASTTAGGIAFGVFVTAGGGGGGQAPPASRYELGGRMTRRTPR